MHFEILSMRLIKYEIQKIVNPKSVETEFEKKYFLHEKKQSLNHFEIVENVKFSVCSNFFHFSSH